MEIAWRPERVGEGRRFRIIVDHPAPLACSHTGELTLLDRTPESSVGPRHRFYFRASAPTSAAAVTFTAGADETSFTIPVVAESEWDAPTRLGEIDLPRIWPLGADVDAIGLKSRHTIVPVDEIGARRGNPPDPPEELSWSDEELWGLEPPCDIPRWHFLNLDRGCPVHGLEIYHSDPYYPWIVDVRHHPYQVQCPVGGEWYPTNDYLAGDHTSGAYPDDGWGWHAPDGAIFGFISYYLLRRIRFVYGVVRSLANYYHATGDPAAVRKVALLLVTLAREHRYLSYFPDHRFRRYEEVVEEPQYREHKDRISYGPRETLSPDVLDGSGLDDYCINMPYHYEETSRAYDLVFDRIDGDAELIAFVHGKVPELVDGPAIRRYIETFHFRNGAQASLDKATSSNIPRPQMGMLGIIRTLDQPECKPLTEWLVDGEGQVGRMPVNYYYKDGAAYESTGGYNGIHIASLVPIVEGLRALREAHPGLYADPRFDPVEAHERYRHILRWPLDVVVAQLSYPLIGDTGGIPTGKTLLPVPCMDMGDSLGIYSSAVKSFPEERSFRAAIESLVRKQEAVRRAAERGETGTSGFYGTGPDYELRPDPRLALPSRLLDGYGIGILESGTGFSRRGAWLYYGDHPGHCHEQPLDIGLFARGRNLLRHMGYPYSWQHMDTWDGSWITHFGVKVVPAPRDLDEPWWRSTVRLFHRGSGFQAVEALGYGITRRRREEGCEAMPGHAQRRTLALVDLPDGRFYLVDLLHIVGGAEHWWTFHGTPGTLSLEASEEPIAQDGGTVAGPNVPYGGPTPAGTPVSLAYLYDVRRAAVPDSGESVWSATWSIDDANGLRLRATQVGPGGGELIAARGRSPHAPVENPPYELDWLLRHRRRPKRGRAGLSSDFHTIIEADANPPVTAARNIADGPVSGVAVDAGPFRHWILRNDAPDRARTFGPITFSGRMGFVEADEKGLRRMTLIGDGSLTWEGVGIESGAPDWRGTVEALDGPAGRLVVAASTAPPEALVGAYVLISREFEGIEAHDTFAYPVNAVTSLSDGRYELLLGWSPVIADGVVGTPTDTGFRAPGTCPLVAARAYYRGAWLVNEECTSRLRLADMRGGLAGKEIVAVVAAPDRSKAAETFPVGMPFRVEEIGIGDVAEFHGWTEIERRDDETWGIRASGPCRINVDGR